MRNPGRRQRRHLLERSVHYIVKSGNLMGTRCQMDGHINENSAFENEWPTAVRWTAPVLVPALFRWRQHLRPGFLDHLGVRQIDVWLGDIEHGPYVRERQRQ